MAHWKRLTEVDNISIDVNMDAVAYMRGLDIYTEITFVGGISDERRVLAISVKEKPDQIHRAQPLPGL